MAPPSPLEPALASMVAPDWKLALLPPWTLIVPPEESGPSPRADRLAPDVRSTSCPAWMLMAPPLTPLPPGSVIVPETSTSLSATIWIRPSFTTTLVAEARPLALTTSVKLGAVPMNRAPLYSVPPTLMEPAERPIPSSALTCPWMVMSPVSLRGAVPASSWETELSSGFPGAWKKLLTNAWVGVARLRLPTFTTPVRPTTKPAASAK